MNKNKYAVALIVVALFTVGAFAIGRQINPTKNTQSPQPQATFAPEHVTYRMLFHHVHLLNQQAEKAERESKFDSARAYRKAFKNDAQFSDQQTVALNDIAARCELAVKDVDARAKVIIDARRAHYLRTGNVLPPSELLDALQAERNRTILHYRDALREALGEQEWGRFREFVQQRVAANITVNPRSR